MHLPLVPSNTAKCPSQAELGQSTSPLHCQSAPSHTEKDEEHPLVSHIVTVVTFQALELSTQAIQFQVAQVSHLSPLGIPKLNTAALQVQLLLTVAQHHASNVVVVHALTVAAVPVSHLSHFKQTLASHNTVTHPSVSVKSISSQLKAAAHTLAQVSHLHPCGHCGTVKLKTALWQSQELVTQAQVQGVHVVVLPTHTVAAFHVSHFSHLRLEY